MTIYLESDIKSTWPLNYCGIKRFDKDILVYIEGKSLIVTGNVQIPISDKIEYSVP